MLTASSCMGWGLVQGPSVTRDSHSPMTSGRNRENPTPLPDPTMLPGGLAGQRACGFRCPAWLRVCILIPGW